MKRTFLIIVLLLTWMHAAQAQLHYPIQKVAVGDTLILSTGVIERSQMCGPVSQFRIYQSDSANFLQLHDTSGSDRRYSLFFTPKSAGTFLETFDLSWFYQYIVRGCNYPPPAESNGYLCEGVRDSVLTFRPYTYSKLLDFDTAQLILHGVVHATVHNWSDAIATFDSVTYLGTKSKFYTLSFDSDLTKKHSIPVASTDRDTMVAIHIYSTYGPNSNIQDTVGAIIHEHFGSTAREDTLFVIVRTSTLLFNLHFVRDSAHRGDEYHFKNPGGTTADTTVTFQYIPLIWGLSIDSFAYPFQLMSVDTLGTNMTMHIRCSPAQGEMQPTNTYQIIRYHDKLINGDSVALEWWLPFTLSWEPPDMTVPYHSDVSGHIVIVPNPAQDYVRVFTDNSPSIQSAELLSLSGVLVRRWAQPEIRNVDGAVLLGTGQLAKGTYFLRLFFKGTSVTQKVVIQ